MSLIRCEKYPPFAFTYNAHHTACAVSTLAPVKSSAIAVLQILSWMLKSTYLRFYCLSVENAILVILHICWQIKRVSPCLRYVNHDSGQIRYSYISCYSGINIQMNVSPLRLVDYRQIDDCYTSHLLSNTGHNVLFALWQHCSRSNPL
jgi:hypothetical protein